MEKKPKISSTAYRVLLLLNLLSQDEKSVDELNSIFSKDAEISRTFTKEVIIKYISTLKLAGYKISKPSSSNKHSYTLLKSPVLIQLTEEEIQVLAILDNYVCGLYQNKLKNKYDEFITKLSKYLSDEQLSMLISERKKIKDNINFSNPKYKKYADIISKLEQYCNEERRIQITYQLPCDIDEKEVVLEPKKIKYDANNVYIAGFNAVVGERQLLNIDFIKEVKQLPQKSKYNQVLSPVVFKLRGRLARGYTLYENEKISEKHPDGTITITTYVDDKNMLLQRLLKYGELCEIVYPGSVRDKMITVINETLNNYSE